MRVYHSPPSCLSLEQIEAVAPRTRQGRREPKWLRWPSARPTCDPPMSHMRAVLALCGACARVASTGGRSTPTCCAPTHPFGKACLMLALHTDMCMRHIHGWHDNICAVFKNFRGWVSSGILILCTYISLYATRLCSLSLTMNHHHYHHHLRLNLILFLV